MRTLQCAVAVLLAGMAVLPARAQLAITEVLAQGTMSVSCTTPDYWELTNYGTDPVDLDAYRFYDNTSQTHTVNPFEGLVIQGEKSVIFMRSQATACIHTGEHFTNWWGAANLSERLQEVRLYDGPGLSGAAGDMILLYDGFDNLVDTVSFGRSIDGRSFIPNLDTGIFGDLSAPDVNGAFRAAAYPSDVGSPGFSPAAIPLSIRTEPLDLEVDASGDATLVVEAAGLPRPRYRWTHFGLDVPGGTNASLTLSNLQPSQAGKYQVEVSNAFGQASSREATLTVITNCTCARLVSAPDKATVFPGQHGIFFARARAYPPPRYQWSANGVEIPGATSGTFVAESVTLEMSGTVYSVRVWNDPSEQCPSVCAATNASAVLKVTRRPVLQITEVMAAARPDAALIHDDWFEVSNADTEEVDLQGYRFIASDGSTNAIATARRILEPLVLKPGASVIFARDATAEQFREWWGADLLPPDLQIYTFSGFGLNNTGEGISLWNPGATGYWDAVATCSFPASDIGVSFIFSHYCDEDGCGTLSPPMLSVSGQNGAFPAFNGGDIGSPGYTSNPKPRLLGLDRDAAGVTVRCRVVQGKSCRLWFKNRLDDPTWAPLEPKEAEGFVTTFRDNTVNGTPARFYRLEELP